MLKNNTNNVETVLLKPLLIQCPRKVSPLFRGVKCRTLFLSSEYIKAAGTAEVWNPLHRSPKCGTTDVRSAAENKV